MRKGDLSDRTVATIYVLVDPRTEEIRYVGGTNRSLKARLGRHLAARGKNHRVAWLALLKRRGLIPLIRVVQQVPVQYYAEAERYWIAYFRTMGCRLVNSTDGGDGLLNPTEEIR